MKKVLLYCVVIFTTNLAIGQTETSSERMSFEPYVGIPNNANYLLYRKYSGEDPTVSNYQTVGTPVLFGFRAEVSSPESRLGFGIDVNYEESGYKHSYIDTSYKNNILGFEEFDLKYKANKLRLMLKISYYFVDRPKFQTSINVSGGYRYVTRKEQSTDPYFEPIESKNSIPFAGRIAVTMKV